MTFREKLARAAERNHSLLCVGLDPDPDLVVRTAANDGFQGVVGLPDGEYEAVQAVFLAAPEGRAASQLVEYLAIEEFPESLGHRVN